MERTPSHADDWLSQPPRRGARPVQPWSDAARVPQARRDVGHAAPRDQVLRRVLTRWEEHTADELRGDQSLAPYLIAWIHLAKPAIWGLLTVVVAAGVRAIGWSPEVTSLVLKVMAAAAAVGLMLGGRVRLDRDAPQAPPPFTALTAARRRRARAEADVRPESETPSASAAASVRVHLHADGG
jgi:hypothetical protein